MKTKTLQGSFLSFGIALAAGSTANTVRASPSTQVPRTMVLSVSHSAKSSTTKIFKGSLEDMQQWGQIRVNILVKNKRITGVKVLSDYHTGRSQIIQSDAIPLLKQETLKAQNAKINTISGATDTSDAYTASLQSAVKAAKHAKALK